MSREEDIDNAVYDVVSQHLYAPVEFLTVAETVTDEYEEYADDTAFIETVYNKSGAIFKELFERYSGTGTTND